MKINQTCHGPVGSDGVCNWCQHQYEPTGQTEVGDTLVDIYPPQCMQQWTDRPRKDVTPEFAQIPVRLMRFRCWGCGTMHGFNSMETPAAFQIIDQNSVLHVHCGDCGKGMNVRKAAIISLEHGRAILNQSQNRQQRRAAAKKKHFKN